MTARDIRYGRRGGRWAATDGGTALDDVYAIVATHEAHLPAVGHLVRQVQDVLITPTTRSLFVVVRASRKQLDHPELDVRSVHPTYHAAIAAWDANPTLTSQESAA